MFRCCLGSLLWRQCGWCNHNRNRKWGLSTYSTLEFTPLLNSDRLYFLESRTRPRKLMGFESRFKLKLWAGARESRLTPPSAPGTTRYTHVVPTGRSPIKLMMMYVPCENRATFRIAASASTFMRRTARWPTPSTAPSWSCFRTPSGLPSPRQK